MGQPGSVQKSCRPGPNSPLESACWSSLSEITPLLSLSTLQNQDQISWGFKVHAEQTWQAQNVPRAGPSFLSPGTVPPRDLRLGSAGEGGTRSVLHSSRPCTCRSPRCVSANTPSHFSSAPCSGFLLRPPSACPKSTRTSFSSHSSFSHSSTEARP